MKISAFMDLEKYSEALRRGGGQDVSFVRQC